jgi:hypothetical protein
LTRFQDHRFNQIGQNLLKIDEFEPKSFENILPAEIRPIFQTIYLETTVNPIESHDRLLEIQKIVAILDSFYLKDRLNIVLLLMPIKSKKDLIKMIHERLTQAQSIIV